MQRDMHRAPRYPAGRERFPFAFVLTILAALAVASAPGCNSSRTSGAGESTGTTQQALGTSAQPIIVLHSFGGTGDGDEPGPGQLLLDSSGNLYGTTELGGAHTGGTVFKVTSSGTESVLYSFCPSSGCADGSFPEGVLTQDSSGNLYGTTHNGGANTGGTAFKVTSGGTESVLHSFCPSSGCADGIYPEGGLIQDSSGNLYGTASGGGANGFGAVFKVTSGGTESVLYSFCATYPCADGESPGNGSLIQDSSGNLYGTTTGGGAHSGGTVFKLTSGGTESVLHSFCSTSGCADGQAPNANLVMDAAGNLYGTTPTGGGSSDRGTVFKITSGGTESVLYTFCPVSGCADGSGPVGGVVLDSAGNLYGTTQGGGANSLGTVFKVDPSGNETVLYSFCSQAGCADGEYPTGGLIQDSSGNLYGATLSGGAHGGGTAFAFSTLPGKQLGCNCSLAETGSAFVGDPINVGSGNAFYQYVDYATAGQNPLAFTRYYNSRGNASGITTLAGELGGNWRSSFDRYIQIVSSSEVIAERADGEQLTFALSGSTWTPDTDVDVTLTHSGSTWTLTDHDDTVESYTTSGGMAALNSIAARNGYTQTLTYTSGALTSVSDSYSRTLTLAYNGDGTLHTLATPDSTTITYGYTSNAAGAQLTSVAFPTSPTQTITYVYANSSLPFALTSITDENGNTFESWTYDSFARGLTNQQGSGANLVTLVYNTSGTRTVTNALGVIDTYSFSALQGVPKVTGISRASTGTTAAATEAFTYDSNGFTASRTDWNGNATTYTNNAHGMPTSLTEAYGSSVARTTTIAYNSTHVHLPDSIATPGVTTSFTYDSSGDVLTKVLTDTTSTSSPYSTNGQTRTWTNTWGSHLLASVETPNSNTTTYGYSSGSLTSITNALSQVTSITSHTAGGRPLTVVDPNSVTTTLTYDARQRLLTSAVTMSAGTRTTTYAYDKAGELTQTTLPDSSYIANTYDTAHRITQITDALGNYTTYTLDALGDKTATNTYHYYGSLYAQHGGTFDALGRLLVDTGGRSQTTTYTYDANGNALTVTDGRSHTTTNTFDALNRLGTSTDANSGVTTYSYDAHDRTTNVQDALSHSTSYVFNGFGDAIQQASPDTGTTVYTYDSDANLTKTVDAASVETDMAYDALDRMTSKTRPSDGSQNAYLAYDSTGWPFGDAIGRLTGVSDAAGYAYFGYDERGEINFQRRTYSSTNYDVYVSYDAAGRYNGSAYPSSLWAGIVSRNAAGQVAEAAAFPTGSGSYDVVAWMGTGPFGPMDYIDYGNGVYGPISRDYDYNISNLTLTTSGSTVLQNTSYTLDGANNVTSISDAVHAANGQTLGYDVINRLTSATSGTGGHGSLAWAYDKVGNLTSSTVGSTTTTYALTSGTNRLASYTQGSTTTVSTNTVGNITSIPPAVGGGASTFSYNVANRLSGVTGGGSTTASYVYGFDGHRVTKTVGGVTTLYIYGVNGELLEEKNLSTGATTDYIAVEGRPLGIFIPGGGSGTLYYVHPDNLGTPQFVTDSSESVVWSAMDQPYGTANVTTSTIAQNIRLPGQYYDSETGFHQNGFRDYMPPFGRYLESDLIGLKGGMNTYLYANANPGRYTDTFGLASQSPYDSIADRVAFGGQCAPGYCPTAGGRADAIRALDNITTGATAVSVAGTLTGQGEVTGSAVGIGLCAEGLKRLLESSNPAAFAAAASVDYGVKAAEAEALGSAIDISKLIIAAAAARR